MATVGSSGSYAHAMARRSDLALADRRRLLTDRSAYVGYLEAQLERVSAACLETEALRGRVGAFESRSGDLEARLLRVARVVQLCQRFSEEKASQWDEERLEVRREVQGVDRRVVATGERVDGISGVLEEVKSGLRSAVEALEHEKREQERLRENCARAHEVAAGAQHLAEQLQRDSAPLSALQGVQAASRGAQAEAKRARECASALDSVVQRAVRDASEARRLVEEHDSALRKQTSPDVVLGILKRMIDGTESSSRLLTGRACSKSYKKLASLVENLDREEDILGLLEEEEEEEEKEEEEEQDVVRGLHKRAERVIRRGELESALSKVFGIVLGRERYRTRKEEEWSEMVEKMTKEIEVLRDENVGLKHEMQRMRDDFEHRLERSLDGVKSDFEQKLGALAREMHDKLTDSETRTREHTSSTIQSALQSQKPSILSSSTSSPSESHHWVDALATAERAEQTARKGAEETAQRVQEQGQRFAGLLKEMDRRMAERLGALESTNIEFAKLKEEQSQMSVAVQDTAVAVAAHHRRLERVENYTAQIEATVHSIEATVSDLEGHHQPHPRPPKTPSSPSDEAPKPPSLTTSASPALKPTPKRILKRPRRKT